MDQLFFEGVFQITNIFLSIVAMIIAIPLLRFYKTTELRPWKYVLIGLVAFDILLIVAALRSFGAYESPYVTHLLATVILLLLITAQRLQLKTWSEGTPK